MNYVKSLDLFGVNVKEIPCITGNGAPTTATPGAIGCLYMDSSNGDIYVCTAVNSGVYTWKKLGGAKLYRHNIHVTEKNNMDDYAWSADIHFTLYSTNSEEITDLSELTGLSVEGYGDSNVADCYFEAATVGAIFESDITRFIFTHPSTDGTSMITSSMEFYHDYPDMENYYFSARITDEVTEV